MSCRLFEFGVPMHLFEYALYTFRMCKLQEGNFISNFFFIVITLSLYLYVHGFH